MFGEKIEEIVTTCFRQLCFNIAECYHLNQLKINYFSFAFFILSLEGFTTMRNVLPVVSEKLAKLEYLLAQFLLHLGTRY